jgi:hypothetical protein
MVGLGFGLLGNVGFGPWLVGDVVFARLLRQVVFG